MFENESTKIITPDFTFRIDNIESPSISSWKWYFFLSGITLQGTTSEESGIYRVLLNVLNMIILVCDEKEDKFSKSYKNELSILTNYLGCYDDLSILEERKDLFIDKIVEFKSDLVRF